ncbi:MAG: DMT family transporter [Atopobiaceae bacterium]|nr:DMT family transporter [Atopobiaceae bacterium]
MQQRKPMLARMGMVVALATLSCALWGSAFAFVKMGYELFGVASNSPAQQMLFAGMRFCLAGVFVLAGTAVVRRRLPVPTRNDLAPIALLALSQTTLQYVPFYIGLAHASGTNSALVQGTSAFVQIVLATLVFAQEKLTLRKLVGCTLGLGGVAMVTLRGGGMVGSWSYMGEGLVFASVVAGGCAACLMRRYGSGGDPLLLTGWQFLLGGSVMVLLGIALGGRITMCSPQALGVLAYLGFLSASAFSMWSLLLKYNPVSRVAMFRFFIPMFGVLFSVVALGEMIPVAQLPALVVALGLIVVGTVLVNTDVPREGVSD